jgi:hypothetical protein
MGYYATHGVSIAAFSEGVGPVESLAAQSATTATPVVLDAGTVRPNAVLTVTTSTGVTAGEVVLQASNDGINFWTVSDASVSTTAASTTTSIVATSVYARYFQAAITTAVAGGTVNALVGASG